MAGNAFRDEWGQEYDAQGRRLQPQNAADPNTGLIGLRLFSNGSVLPAVGAAAAAAQGNAFAGDY